MRHARLLLLALLLALGAPASAATQRVCWPAFTIAAVNIPASTIPASTIPASTIPASTIPAGCFAGHCHPAIHLPAVHLAAVHLPAVHLAAVHLPARHIRGACFSSLAVPSPAQTTVRVSRYNLIDPKFSPELSDSYWTGAGPTVSYPDVYAAGFGGLNAAGFPKNQYVRPYLRRDGTYVNGYWRNSPSDGLPTCHISSC